MAAPPARAVDLVTPAGRKAQPFTRWAKHLYVPTVPERIVVERSDAPCGGSPACSVPGTIYFAPSNHDSFSFVWELGQQFDAYVLNDHDRREFALILRFPADKIEPPPGEDPSTQPWGIWAFTPFGDQVAEIFADQYALCATAAPYDYDLNVAPGFTTLRQVRQICSLIKRSYARLVAHPRG